MIFYLPYKMPGNLDGISIRYAKITANSIPEAVGIFTMRTPYTGYKLFFNGIVGY